MMSTHLDHPHAPAHDALPDEDGNTRRWREQASRSLHPSARTVDDEALAVIAAGLAQVTVPWELRPDATPTERHAERILSTAGYDAWVIFWPAGTGLDLHDHDGSAGSFSVVSGELVETSVDAADGPAGPRTRSRRVRSGESASFGPSDVHAIANTSRRPATSVHVYSPPLAAMAYFEADESGALQTVREDAGTWND